MSSAEEGGPHKGATWVDTDRDLVEGFDFD